MTRNQIRVLPLSPKFFADIKIDPPWSMTLSKKRFLLYQESEIKKKLSYEELQSRLHA